MPIEHHLNRLCLELIIENSTFPCLFRFLAAIPFGHRFLRDSPLQLSKIRCWRVRETQTTSYHYVEFSRSTGYRAFAKAKNKSIRGIIVVRKDSEIEHLSDFDQQTLAFPAPAAFAATVLPRAQFTRDGIEVTPKYVSSHDSVYMAVARGMFVGGGGVKRTLSNVSPAIRNRLRILWTSQPYTSHPLAAHPRLDMNKTNRIAHALTEMENSEQGRSFLKELGWKGVEIAEDKQWDDVRELRLEPLVK